MIERVAPLFPDVDVDVPRLGLARVRPGPAGAGAQRAVWHCLHHLPHVVHDGDCCTAWWSPSGVSAVALLKMVACSFPLGSLGDRSRMLRPLTFAGLRYLAHATELGIYQLSNLSRVDMAGAGARDRLGDLRSPCLPESPVDGVLTSLSLHL